MVAHHDADLNRDSHDCKYSILSRYPFCVRNEQLLYVCQYIYAGNSQHRRHIPDELWPSVIYTVYSRLGVNSGCCITVNYHIDFETTQNTNIFACFARCYMKVTNIQSVFLTTLYKNRSSSRGQKCQLSLVYTQIINQVFQKIMVNIRW